MVHVSSTYFFQKTGLKSNVDRALSSCSSITEFAIVTNTGGPHTSGIVNTSKSQKGSIEAQPQG